MRRNLLGSAALAVIVSGLSVAPANAVVVSVAAQATGMFGDQFPATTDMVTGWTFNFSSPIVSQTISIDVPLSDTIDIGLGNITTANGSTVSSSATPTQYTPLEEKIVDGGGFLPIRNVPDYGSLIGIFVPKAIVDTLGFIPRDEDLTAIGLDADDLFFIGAGPTTFTATQSGTLFLGINDTFASNNSGQFDVNLLFVSQVIPVPEPASGALIAIGACGLVHAARRRGRRRLA